MSKLEKDIQRELLKLGRKHYRVAWLDRANSGKVKVNGEVITKLGLRIDTDNDEVKFENTVVCV